METTVGAVVSAAPAASTSAVGSLSRDSVFPPSSVTLTRTFTRFPTSSVVSVYIPEVAPLMSVGLDIPSASTRTHWNV